MRGIEAHFTGKLTKDAELRRTQAGKEMVALLVAIDTHDGEPAFCSVLAFEALAEQVAGLQRGAEVYVRGKLRAEVYTPKDGAARVSLSMFASAVEPLVLAHPKARKRQPVVYGDGAPRRRSSYTKPARGGEDFDDAL